VHPVGADEFPRIRSLRIKPSEDCQAASPSPWCKAANKAFILHMSILNMSDPDLKDDMLAGQGVIKIKGHRLFVNGMYLKRNECPPRTR